jgi:Cu-processing system permease protein
MNGLMTIAYLTYLEARRRRVVFAALMCGMTLLLIFAIAVYLITHAQHPVRPPWILETRIQLQMLSLAGLYAVNLLAVALAIVLPLDSLSGEIASGIMQTLASKPIRRSEIVLGKWLVYWVMIAAYVAMMVAGVVVSMRLITGFVQVHVSEATGLITLEATVLLCVVVAAGVRFTTVTNGMIAFALYAIAVVGGWIEQIGVMVSNAEAHYIGTVISLVSPTDALWRRAVYLLQPPVMSQVQITAYSPASVPTAAMVWWAVAFAFGALVLALRWFDKRPL